MKSNSDGSKQSVGCRHLHQGARIGQVATFFRDARASTLRCAALEGENKTRKENENENETRGAVEEKEAELTEEVVTSDRVGTSGNDVKVKKDRAN